MARECCRKVILACEKSDCQGKTYQALAVGANGGQHRGSDLLHNALNFSDLVLQRDVLLLRLLGISANPFLVS